MKKSFPQRQKWRVCFLAGFVSILTACTGGVGLNTWVGGSPLSAGSALEEMGSGTTVLSSGQATDDQDSVSETSASPLELENLPVTISKNGDVNVSPRDGCDTSDSVQMILLAPDDSARIWAFAGVGGSTLGEHRDVLNRLANQVLQGLYGTLEGEDTSEQFVFFVSSDQLHLLALNEELQAMTCGPSGPDDVNQTVWTLLTPQKLESFEMEIGPLSLLPDRVILDGTSAVRSMDAVGRDVPTLVDADGETSDTFYFIILRPAL